MRDATRNSRPTVFVDVTDWLVCTIKWVEELETLISTASDYFEHVPNYVT